MLLRPFKLLSISRDLVQLCKAIRLFHLNTSKLCRVVSNSGCLVAGCCFSKKSDEDSLLPNKTKNYVGMGGNNRKNDLFHPNSSIEQDNMDSRSMKRNSDFIEGVVSLDAIVDESTIQTTNLNIKKRKIAEQENKNDKDIQLKLSNIASDSLACNVEEQSREEKTEPPKKIRPNYFVAVRVSNKEIHDNLRRLQDHILSKDDRLKRSMTDLKTLHITLMVMHIGDEETHARALKALERTQLDNDQDMSQNALQLQFKGLSHFQNRVLFAKLSADDSYQRLSCLADDVKKNFASEFIFTTDKRKEFTPHLTVAKIDFNKKHNKFVKRIDPKLYKGFNDDYFGTQQVESIQLLRMMGPKNEEGYYSGNEIYFSAFDPKNRMQNLCEMLEIEKKKKDVKEVINALMKEKLK